MGPAPDARPNTAFRSRRGSTAGRPRACSATPIATRSTRWCCIPASGSARRRSRTPISPPASPGSTTSGSRTTASSSDGRLRGIAVTPIEHGDVAIDIMREAKDLGLVATHIPPALENPQPRPPRPRSVLCGRRRAGDAPRHPRCARRSPSEDRRRPVHELHSGALHQLSVRPDDGDDRTRVGRCLRPASRFARRVPRGRSRLGAVLHRSAA